MSTPDAPQPGGSGGTTATWLASAARVPDDRAVEPVRLSLELLPHVARLVAGVRGVEQLPPDARDGLRAAGLLAEDDVPAPVAQLLAETLDATIVELEVELASAGGLVTAYAFLSPAGGVLATPAADLDGPPDLAELTLHPTAEVVYRLVELLDVGARPHVQAAAVSLPAGAFDELLAVPAAEAIDALEEVFGGERGLPPRVLAPLVDVLRHARAHWSVTASVPLSGGRVATRRFEVVDGAVAGLWTLLRDTDRHVLVPTTGRAVVAGLEGLLPTDGELETLARS